MTDVYGNCPARSAPMRWRVEWRGLLQISDASIIWLRPVISHRRSSEEANKLASGEPPCPSQSRYQKPW